MDNEEKVLQPGELPEQAPRERKFGIRFRLKPWNIASGAAVLAASAVFFVICFFLAWEEEPTGRLPIYGWYTAAYAGLTLLAAVLCLVEVTLPGLLRRLIGWVLVLLMPLGVFFAVDLVNSTGILDFSYLKGFANYLCYLMVFALIYAISRRAWVTALVGGAIFLLFGIANYYVVQFRGQPILPWDLQSVSTAATVSGGYEYVPTRSMALSVLCFLCVILLCVRLGPKGKEGTGRVFRIAERLSALAVSVALFILLFPMDILSNMGISVWAWNQKTSSEISGIAAGFYANIQFMMVEKPEGYSEQKLQELSQEIDSLEDPEPLGTPEGNPTIIAVMNESLTDMQSVGKGSIELEPDNLMFIHSLQRAGGVIWGTAYSSVYGGNTCNSEYEFLTGNTTAFLPSGSKPYQQYVDREQTALVSTLQDQGYDCIAIHPGNRGAWQRDIAYPYLGFQEFIDVKAFDVRRKLEHHLTSDVSCYDQVIYEYENRNPEKSLFLFNVTIQNHGGYEDEDFNTTVRIKEAAGEFPQTEQYLSLTQKSDDAFRELVDYFSQQEDPVVILMFGDHWPNLEYGFLTKLLGADSWNLDFEDLMREYEVPFLIWANYPLKNQQIEKISLNYLSGLLLRAAGLEGTDYTKYLEDLRQTLPVVTAIGTFDKEGDLYRNGDETPYDDLLNDYAILQYNNAFGGENKKTELFVPEEKGAA